MMLNDLSDGDNVFIDANIFIYHFGGRSAHCRAFLERCARSQLTGYTSTHILAEVLHRLMVAEAVQRGLVNPKTAVKKLKEKPDLIKQLTRYNADVNKARQMNIVILSLTPEAISASEEVRANHGLLTNDSLVAATMSDHGLTKLATTDGDFERISGIEVYKPNDI